MIRRPTNIPRQAVYSIRDGWWQIGEVVDGKPFGPWRTFRPDGSPLFEARFDSKGRLQGTFKRFHPDGSLARLVKYSRGTPTGKATLYRAKGASGDIFPSSDPRCWQIVVDHDDDDASGSQVYLDERGVELVDERASEGDEHVAPEATGALDPTFASASPDDFLASGAFAKLVEPLPAAAPAPVDRFLMPYEGPARRPLEAKRYQDLYGKPMPASLRAWLEATAKSPALYGLRVTRDADLATDGNQIEALILEYQGGPAHSIGLAALASGLVPIGESPDRRLRYCAAIAEQPDAPTDAVYVLTPYEESIQIPVARTLDDFAYLCALFTAFDRGEISNACLAEAYQRLRGRVDLRDPMTQIEQRALDEDDLSDDEVVGNPEEDHAEGFHFRRPESAVGYFYFRNRWLFRLLAGDAEAAATTYRPAYDGALDDTRFETILKRASEPLVAFYWAFRLLAFDDPRLAKFLAVAGDSPSQLGRDAVALVGELAKGRKKLGAIDDFQELVKKFRTLDPMANKDEEEEEEEEEDENETENDEDENLDDNAAAMKVVAWATARGYERDDLSIRAELDVAAVGLAMRADPSIALAIAKLVEDDPWHGGRLLAPWLDEDRADFAQLVPLARDWLRDRESGAIDRWVAACGVLARAGTPQDAKLIGDVLEPSLDQMFGRGLGFEAAMGQHDLEEAIGPMCAAIAKLGISETVIAALEGVVSADTHLVDRTRGPCALALASINRGIDAIVTGIQGQVDRGHAHNISSEMLEAIGILGKKNPERIDELRALVESLPKLRDEAKLGQKIALHDLGRPCDLAGQIRAALSQKMYKDDGEDAAEKRAALLAIVERRTDVSAELALPYATSEHMVLARAARRVLRARGIAPPELRLYDPFHVRRLAREGRHELHDALSDTHGLALGNVALWLGDHPHDSSRAPLMTFARTFTLQPLPQEGPRYYALRWTVRALIAIGGADALFDELLSAADRGLADPVLRYADKLGPEVARGMVHVFETDEHWRLNTARSWLAKHKADPRIAAALAERGLALEDVTRTKEK